MLPWIQAVRSARETRLCPVFCIHYASCFNATGSSPFIVAIAVHALGFDQTKAFSLDILAEREGAQTPSAELEKLLLEEFHCYLERMQKKYPAAWWIHWAMRDAAFGWPALERRSQALLNRPLPISMERQVDFHAVLAHEYGRDFVPRPQLLHLAELNQLSTVDVLSGMQEMDAGAQGDDDLLQRSSSRKAELIAHLLTRYAQGTLKMGTAVHHRRQRSWPLCTDPTLTRSLLNVLEASRLCGVSRATWYRLQAQGRAPKPLKIGRRTLWDAKELQLWIAAQCPPLQQWSAERKLHKLKEKGQ